MKKQESNDSLLLVVSILITWSTATTFLYLVSLISETVAIGIAIFITAIALVLLPLVIAEVIINKFKKTELLEDVK